jgi:hypothetical protein
MPLFRLPAILIFAATLVACGAQSPQADGIAHGAAAGGATAAAVAGPGTASARAELVAAFERLAAARSYRAVIEGDEASGQERVQLEYVAPDRLRATTAEGVQTIIGGEMHLQIDGQHLRQPAPAGVLDGLLGQWRHAARMLELASTRVESMGREQLEGRAATRYRIANDEAGGALGLVWVADGYPVRIDTHDAGTSAAANDRVSLHYSHINDPGLRIEPPG